MGPRRQDTDEARFRRSELDLLKRAHRRRHLDMALGGLLIAAIVAVIFWLIGLSPPPAPKDGDSLNTVPPAEHAAKVAIRAHA